MSLPARVRIVEVGPRDGLQNEAQIIGSDIKVALINKLSNAGLSYIEAGSFVNPQWVPQMAGSDAVFADLDRKPAVTYAALTPNLKGYQRAVAAGASEVAIFAAASEAFSQKNINCSIEQSIRRFEPVMQAAAVDGIKVRGYLSCVVGCPYQGSIEPQVVAELAEQLLSIGCYEVSLGDTIGIATVADVHRLLEVLAKNVPIESLAVHFHDSYGQALANIYAALEQGITVVDSSISGLGGCPYAKGATGNVATEDLLYLLNGLGIHTGVDMQKLLDASRFIDNALNRVSASRVARALSV
jgi:hydroxymethylglutaryl-CoA lyase